jgi:hypothetical protein
MPKASGTITPRSIAEARPAHPEEVIVGIGSVDAKGSLSAEESWAPLYAAGAVAAFAYAALVIAPLALMIVAPLPPSEGGAAVLDYVNAHRGVYVAELLCFVGLCLPAAVVFLALGVALRSAGPSLALLGSAAGLVSEIAALAGGSSPPSLNGGLVVLAARYATAVGPERAALAAGAEALVANANAVTMIGSLAALGILLLSALFAKGGLGRAAGLLGIATGAAGIFLEAARPWVGPVYGLYGLLLPAWFVVAGLGLSRLSRRARLPGPSTRT